MNGKRRLGATTMIAAPLEAALAGLWRTNRRKAKVERGRRHLAPPPEVVAMNMPTFRTAIASAPQTSASNSLAREGAHVASPVAGAAVRETDSMPREEVSAAKTVRPKRKRRLLGWLLYFGLIAALIVGAPRALAWILGSQYPMAAVTSSSMWPTLKKGELILIQGVDKPTDLKVGDIIAFKHNSGFAIHRIIAIEGETITTQGDANDEPDAPITFDEVIGRALRVRGRLAKIPYLGNIPLLFGRTTDTGAGQAESAPVFEGGPQGESGASVSD